MNRSLSALRRRPSCTPLSQGGFAVTGISRSSSTSGAMLSGDFDLLVFSAGGVGGRGREGDISDDRLEFSPTVIVPWMNALNSDSDLPSRTGMADSVLIRQRSFLRQNIRVRNRRVNVEKTKQSLGLFVIYYCPRLSRRKV